MALIALVVGGGCSFPSRTAELACQTTPDCDGDRICQGGFCIRGDEQGLDAQGVDPDGPDPDAMQTPDADPFEAIAALCTTAGYSPAPGVTGSLFKDVATGRNWANAQADCKDDVAGATHLIVLSSTAEVTFMGTKRGWVGLFDNDTNVFQSVTGEPDDLRPFDNNQPDNGGGDENCVRMIDGTVLDDDQCGNNHRYVCECDGKASNP